MPGLLEGVRVVDLTHYLSGPYCTKLLATLGAEVVKIERPGSGDPVRRLGPFANPDAPSPSTGEGWDGDEIPPTPLYERGAKVDFDQISDAAETGAWFLYLNTSKKSVTLNLKTEEGRDILRQFLGSAQIVVENFSPGTLEDLGLGYQTYRASTPSWS